MACSKGGSIRKSKRSRETLRRTPPTARYLESWHANALQNWQGHHHPKRERLEARDTELGLSQYTDITPRIGPFNFRLRLWQVALSARHCQNYRPSCVGRFRGAALPSPDDSRPLDDHSRPCSEGESHRTLHRRSVCAAGAHF